MDPGRAVATLFCLLGATGCSSFHSALSAKTGEKLYAVKVESTAFYRYSPRQGNGPDKTIERDTTMKLIRRSPAFCKVHLLTGEDGFVANDDIGPASEKLIASNTAPVKPIGPSSEWRAEVPEPRSNAPEPALPEFEPTPIPLPSGIGN